MFDKLTIKTIVFVLTIRTKFKKIEISTIISKNDDLIKKNFNKIFDFEWFDMTLNEMCLLDMLINDKSIVRIILIFTNSNIHENFMKNHY